LAGIREEHEVQSENKGSSVELQGWLFGILGMLIFSLTLPMTRMAVESLSPYFVASGRSMLAAFVGLPILLITSQPRPTRLQWKGLWLAGLGVIFGFPVLMTVAMQFVPASHGGVVLGILPLTTAITSTILLRERPSFGFWTCGVLGSTAVIIFSLKEGGGSFQTGDWLLFGAVIFASYGYVKGAEISAQLGSWQTICWTLLSWCPILIPTLWFSQDLPEEVSWSSWIGFIYVALFSQFLGFFAWYKGLAMGGVARVSQTQLLMPFFVLFFSWLILGEPIGWETFLFAGFVVGTVAIGKRMVIQRKPSRE
jgi:drug/metabolite transporter (DMT)-like permease